ncbi:mlr2098 [Mesorhizobium japonicum MAFF 303099]|nr:mlr2098 [Mesorhizobium japonicum MAFF 303099]
MRPARPGLPKAWRQLQEQARPCGLVPKIWLIRKPGSPRASRCDGTIVLLKGFAKGRAAGRPTYSRRPVTIRVGGGPFRFAALMTCGTFLTKRRWSSPVRQTIRKKEHSMGSTSDKASGLANEAVGKAKEGVGKAVGNDRLRAEGAAQEAKGKVQKAVGDAKSAVKDATNKTAAAINKNL